MVLRFRHITPFFSRPASLGPLQEFVMRNHRHRFHNRTGPQQLNGIQN